MIMYKQILNRDGSVISDWILRVLDNANIPFDPANTDYQQYLKWVAEGNEPLPAENE
jgi:hypothetical protein